MKISKRMKLLSDSVDRDKLYSVDDGLALVKDTAKAKFDESVDAVSYTHLTLPTMLWV